MLKIAVDSGGTFTDFVVSDGEFFSIFKVPSTPHHPAEALLRGLSKVLPLNDGEGWQLFHGTTVCTNAILERNFAKTAFVSNKGFEDILFLARQTRPRLYALEPEIPSPPVEHEDCFGISCRMNFKGEEIEKLDDKEVVALAKKLASYDAVAVCLLFSYANPEHEEKIANALENKMVSLSHEVSPEFREYERAMTTVLNASIGNLMKEYLSELSQRCVAIEKYIMSSTGGLTSVEDAIELPVRTVMSGPAAGVAAAHWLGEKHKRKKLIAFDMGGTSTDVTLILDEPDAASLEEINGLPLRLRRVNVHTIGCGGGSIAYLDSAGALRVGPKSAGADPGPALYGKGNEPTVTDADFLLGRLSIEFFGGGSDFVLSFDNAEKSIRSLAEDLKSQNVIETAAAIVEIAESQMARAIRKVSSEKGYEPADFTLVCFGGAGGMHVCSLAEELGIREILYPVVPGVFSALGLLVAPRVYETSISVLGKASQKDWENVYGELKQKAVTKLGTNFDKEIYYADLRYEGQSHEIEVRFEAGTSFEKACTLFEKQHQKRYGFSKKGRPVEWVTARIRLEKYFSPMEPPYVKRNVFFDKLPSEKEGFWKGKHIHAQVIYRFSLSPGEHVLGPAVLLQEDSTLFLSPNWQSVVLDDATLRIYPI